MRRRIAIRALTALPLLACLGCATTTFQSTWSNPDARPLRLTGRKVVAVFVTSDPLLRRRAEDAMAREISVRGADGVPSYTFLSDREIRDRDAAKAKADALGFAGAVVMRVVGSKTNYYRNPPYPEVWFGPEYRHFWGGYWGWGWGAVWRPGYLAVSRIVKVETLVYSLEQDELVWGGVSRTADPGRIESLVKELAVAVTDRMVKDGVLTRA